MPKASTNSKRSGRLASSGPIADKYAFVAIAVFIYVAIVSPILIYSTAVYAPATSVEVNLQNLMAPRFENKVFWPMLAAVALLLIGLNWYRLAFPPNILCLSAFLGFAAASVLWAYKPEVSFQRLSLQVMLVISIVFPIMLARQTTDTLRALFWLFGLACLLNIPVVSNQNPIIVDNINIGYAGYYSFKGVLGQCAAIAILLALRELLYSGHRRFLGIAVIIVALCLIFVSKSKGSLGMAIIAPIMAGLSLLVVRAIRISPAIILSCIPIFYWVANALVGNLIYRISWHLYGNYDLSGRALIWNFVTNEIAQKPLLGWGFQSFWLVGADGPSILNAPGWVKFMPSGHNGYLDTQLELGYIGLGLLITFILTTLHAIGRVADRDPRRAWLLLSLALFVILTNFLESVWARGSDFLWLIFLVVAAESARYWRYHGVQPAHRRSARGLIGRKRDTLVGPVAVRARSNFNTRGERRLARRALSRQASSGEP